MALLSDETHKENILRSLASVGEALRRAGGDYTAFLTDELLTEVNRLMR